MNPTTPAMHPAVAHFFGLLFLSGGFIAAAWLLPLRLVREHRRRPTIQWLISWSLKGLVLPLCIWTLMNLGLSWQLPAFMPQVQAAQNRGGLWLWAFLRVEANGMFVLSSYWAALTLAWTLVAALAGLEAQARSDLKGLVLSCSLGMGLPAALVFVLGGWPTLGLAASAVLVPIAGYAPRIVEPQKLPPIYARAIARMKFGKYTEAEWEILNELERCEDDFEGWMMLAELYANHFNDLPGAEGTILELCDQPKTTPSQLSIALHRLADWQLKLAGDPGAARRALQIICDRLPGYHLAHMARLRINQLPRTREDLQEQLAQRPIPLPALGDSLDEASAPEESLAGRAQAAATARAYVDTLKQDPNDVSAREKLARVFAERLGRADQGLEQLALLLNMPDQPEGKRADWLSLTAAWHLKYRHDGDSGRRALERLVREFPETPQAFAARRRLGLMRPGPGAAGTALS